MLVEERKIIAKIKADITKFGPGKRMPGLFAISGVLVVTAVLVR